MRREEERRNFLPLISSDLPSNAQPGKLEEARVFSLAGTAWRDTLRANVGGGTTADCTMHGISSGPSGVPSRPYGQLLGRRVFAEGFPPQNVAGWLDDAENHRGRESRMADNLSSVPLSSPFLLILPPLRPTFRRCPREVADKPAPLTRISTRCLCLF